MNKIIKKDILALLDEVVSILKTKEEKDILEMKDLSNHVIHNASIFQDEDSISIAILIYALSKIIERQDKFDYSGCSRLLIEATRALKKDAINGYREKIKELFRFVSLIDSKIGLYIGEVINQAQIKKGTKLYEHGISIAQIADLLNISQWELMRYIGNTTIVDAIGERIDIKSRLEFARSLFR